MLQTQLVVQPKASGTERIVQSLIAYYALEIITSKQRVGVKRNFLKVIALKFCFDVSIYLSIYLSIQ